MAANLGSHFFGLGSNRRLDGTPVQRASCFEMDLEQACVVLAIEYETAEEYCEEVGADPSSIGPADLLAMAALRDEEDLDEEE